MSVTVEITYDVIELESWVRRSHHPSCGAVTTFLGIVRNEEKGRVVESIEYTAYEDMAKNELTTVVEKMTAKHGVVNAVVIHRLGRLRVGEASLGVVVASGHRKEALQCTLEIIDELKKSVPIWKKEFGPDGSWWV